MKEEMPKIQVPFKEAMEEVAAAASSEAARMAFYRSPGGSQLYLLAKSDGKWKKWFNPSEALVREVMMAFNNPSRFKVAIYYDTSDKITNVCVLT